jgi:MSHA biogenesis protein MshP
MNTRRAGRCSKGADRERGFALVSGVFLITILFLLAAYLVSTRVHQDSTAMLDTLGHRAFAAARSGIEWGAYQSLRNGSCAASTSLTFAHPLHAYTATVTCTRSAHDEGGATILVDTLVANACNQPVSGACPNLAPAANYAERQITLTVAVP